MALASYSICMLCYNNGQTIVDSLSSLSGFIKSPDFEVVVVDNESTDDSWRLLKDFEARGVVTVRARCTRGRARELAFENSKGEFIISHLDCDDIFFEEGVRNFISTFHSRKLEEFMLTTRKIGVAERSSVSISSRALIKEAGGWRDLNWGEDWDLWDRVAHLRKYVFSPYPFESPIHQSIRIVAERETVARTKIATRYRKYRDAVKSGRPVFSAGEKRSFSQRAILGIAYSSVLLRRDRLDPIPMPEFDDTLTYLPSSSPLEMSEEPSSKSTK